MHADTPHTDPVDSQGGRPVEAALQTRLITVPLCEIHRVADFACSNSERVQNFFYKEATILIPGNYCRVFVAPNPADETQIWGYYTLSAALLIKEHLSNADEKRAVKHY